MFYTEQFLLLLVILVTTAIMIKWRRNTKKIKFRQPPSLPCLPFVGSLPFIRNFNDMCVFFKDKARELGPIFTLRIGNRLVLILNTKDAIEKAYVRNSSVFSDRPHFVLDELINPGNKGIVFKRKAADLKKPQQLSLSILKEFGFGVKSIMETRICDEIEAMIHFVENKSGEALDPLELSTLATTNIMMNIVFGRRRDYELGLSEMAIQIHRYLLNFSNVYDIIPFIRYLPSYRQQMKNITEATKAALKCIELEIGQCLQETKPCFVQSYIQKAGPDYDRAEFNYILRDLVAAGADTSSTTLQWGFVALANNPAVQKRLQREIDAVIPGDRLPTLEDEAKLPYVEATILEITRWRTLVPMAVPRETSRDCVVDGYFIPSGTMVMSNQFAAHYDIKLWKDPEVFRPERFLDCENNVIGKDQVIPFSLGHRSCLGETMARAELFLILTSLVKRFFILPQEGQDGICEDYKVPVTSGYFPMPFKMRLVERN